MQPFTARQAEVSAYENHNTVSLACSDAGFDGAYRMLHAYEIRPRKDHRGVDLISDALAFGGLWYVEASDAIDYAKFCSQSHHAVIRVYDKRGDQPIHSVKQYS